MGIKQLFFTSTVLHCLFTVYAIDRLSYILKWHLILSFLISQEGNAGGSIQIDNNRSNSHIIGGSSGATYACPLSVLFFYFHARFWQKIMPNNRLSLRLGNPAPGTA